MTTTDAVAATHERLGDVVPTTDGFDAHVLDR